MVFAAIRYSLLMQNGRGFEMYRQRMLLKFLADNVSKPIILNKEHVDLLQKMYDELQKEYAKEDYNY